MSMDRSLSRVLITWIIDDYPYTGVGVCEAPANAHFTLLIVNVSDKALVRVEELLENINKPSDVLTIDVVGVDL